MPPPSYCRKTVVDGRTEYWVRMRVPTELVGIYEHGGRYPAEVVKSAGETQEEFDARSPGIIADFVKEFAECRKRQADVDPLEMAIDRLLKSGDIGEIERLTAAIVQNTEDFIAEARRQRDRDHAKILTGFAAANQNFNDFDAGTRRINEHVVVGTMSAKSQETYWEARSRIDIARAPAVVITLDMAIADWKAAHGPWASGLAENKATDAKERAAKSLLAVAETNNLAAIDAPTIEKWKASLPSRAAYYYIIDVKKLYQCLERNRRFGRWLKNPAAGIETPSRRSRGT